MLTKPRNLPLFAASFATAASLLLLAGCGGSGSDTSLAAPAGKWRTGDFHVHTVQSSDADGSQTLDHVLHKAFAGYGLDWMAVSDHLRLSGRDNNGVNLAAPIPLSTGIERYQQPRIQALQAGGTYADKLIFSGFEWDMPGHDHIGIALFKGSSALVSDPRGSNEFEYLFTNRDAKLFDPSDLAAWRTKYAGQRYYTSPADALQAVSWLQNNYPDSSYAIINHPSRNKGSYSIEDFRNFNDIAPNVFVAIEGMVGNQMESNRGGYSTAYIPENAKERVYGGVDHIVAQVGGVWDALLGEGRRIWNVADSDSHFKTTDFYSSGYFPGEYAKTYIWTQGDGVRDLLAGMRSGKSFAVFGDLIDSLDFNIQGQAGKAEMGEKLNALAGEKVTITIRFKSPAQNNYEKPINSGIRANLPPQVEHVDLIVGDVGPKAKAGTPAYSVATNASTRVLKRFTSKNWKKSADGYNTISYELSAGKNQYFRLRGSNLGTDVAGFTANGEPLADQLISTEDNQARFNEINDRNYAGLWFYSNPVFVSVPSVPSVPSVR